MAEAHDRLVEGQHRSASAAQVDGTMGDNSVTDDRESAGQMPWQAPSERPGNGEAPKADSVARDDRSVRDAPLDRDLGAGLDLTA